MTDREHIREQMLLHFGDSELPSELQLAIEADPELLKEWQELQTLATNLPDDAAFSLSSAEAEQLSKSIETEIDALSNVTPIAKLRSVSTWHKVAALAATIALVILGTLALERMGGSNGVDELTLADPYEYHLIEEQATEEAEVSESIYDALIYEYTSDATAESASALLDDLTEEEVTYLVNNFDVSELLL